jgi:hypothetical protein
VLEKKIIVFPCNIKNVHWAATFVVNLVALKLALLPSNAVRLSLASYVIAVNIQMAQGTLT